MNHFNGYPYPPFPYATKMPHEEDPVEQAERWLKFVKKIKEEAKDEGKKPSEEKKGKLSTVEWFCLLMMCSSIMQAILVLVIAINR